MTNKNITINDLLTLLNQLKKSSYFYNDNDLATDINDQTKTLLSRAAIKQNIDDVIKMIEDRISDINDESTDSTTETYSVTKILSLLSKKQENIYFGSSTPVNEQGTGNVKTNSLWIKTVTKDGSYYFLPHIYAYSTWYPFSTDWSAIHNKLFDSVNSDVFTISGGVLDINQEALMKTSTYVDSETGNIKKSNEAGKITGIDTAEVSYFYGKDKDGNVGFRPIKDEVEQLVVTFADDAEVEFEKNKIIQAITI